VPDATPSHLVVALGKDRKAYLLTETTRGISAPIAISRLPAVLSSKRPSPIDQTEHLRRVPRHNDGTQSSRLSYYCTDPRCHRSSWNVKPGHRRLRFSLVTSTDGTNNMIVWVVGTRIMLLQGTSGCTVMMGDNWSCYLRCGGPNELMAGTIITAPQGLWLVARYVAGDNKVYASPVPTPSPTPRLLRHPPASLQRLRQP